MPKSDCPICGDAYGPRARVCEACAADPANDGWCEERPVILRLVMHDPTPLYEAPMWRPSPRRDKKLIAVANTLRESPGATITEICKKARVSPQYARRLLGRETARAS